MLGVGSNTLVRDGGVEGVVIRLGAGFARVEPRGDHRIYRRGRGARTPCVAREAAQGRDRGAGILPPASRGPSAAPCVMNAGCYGSETKDVLVEAYALTRAGERRDAVQRGPGLQLPQVSAGRPADIDLHRAACSGHARTIPPPSTARMDEITARREPTQPIREKTGGSTFKNPPGDSSWQLVDAAGWRGKPFGGAMFSPLHANFLINTGEATAADLEGLGEAVRADVKAKFGVAAGMGDQADRAAVEPRCPRRPAWTPYLAARFGPVPAPF